ncbi:MAG TPA: hypothetical protein VNT03_04795 [Baekduia sp.]|nr:hypothetical protein [Baekduia sp.]
MSRMRSGEWIAALGAIGLFVTLFLDWWGVEAPKPQDNGSGILNLVAVTLEGSLSGWSTLGWLMDALLCALIFGGAALSYMTIKRASPAWPVGAGVLTWIVGSVIFLMLLVRVTIAQPGDIDGLLSVRLPAYLGLLFAFLIPLGGFLSLRDERTDSPEARAYTPPPARTAPGT